jgi:hypothetical protein
VTGSTRTTQDMLYAVAQVYLIITTRVVWDDPLSRQHTRAGSLHPLPCTAQRSARTGQLTVIRLCQRCRIALDALPRTLRGLSKPQCYRWPDTQLHYYHTTFNSRQLCPSSTSERGLRVQM